MHRSTPSTGGLFHGGTIFGGSNKPPIARRPSTSSGSPTIYTDSAKTSVLNRKASFSSVSKSPKIVQRSRNNSIAIPYLSPKKRRTNSSTQRTDIPLPAIVIGRPDIFAAKPESGDKPQVDEEAVQSPASSRDSFTSTTPYANMLARPGTGNQAVEANGPLTSTLAQPPSLSMETVTYQLIQDTSSKRISTLDYLRKAHEGRVYWFNTLLFNKPDLQRMPYYDSRKLARRATNYLLLGLSLPTIVDLNSSNAVEFLKTLNALLAEFESFQQMHPADGSSSSLSRGRFPQMFKRATNTGSKGRRSSSAADIGLPMGNDSSDIKSNNGSTASGGANSVTSFSMSENDLLPGEEYTHLLTPSLPFDPDFYETFATLCDVLIDCYTKLVSLISSPKDCNSLVAELFTKADARVRKILVQGVVKEFEDSSRSGVKSEVAGVGKVVLGGLM